MVEDLAEVEGVVVADSVEKGLVSAADIAALERLAASLVEKLVMGNGGRLVANVPCID